MTDILADIGHGNMVQRLLSDTSWESQGVVHAIEDMDVKYVTNVIEFIERRLRLTPEEEAMLAGKGYRNRQSLPLMQAMAQRLPLAAQEATTRIVRKAKEEGGRRMKVEATTSVRPKAGMSLAALNGSKSVRKDEQVEALTEAAAELPSGQEIRHRTVGASATETRYNTTTVAGILGVSQSRVTQLVKQGYIEGATQDERTSEWSIPQAGLAKYIRERQDQVKSQLPEGWVDVKRAARMLQCSHVKVGQLLQSGQLNGKREEINGREVWRISERSVEDYRLRQKGVGPEQVREIVSDLVQREGNRLEQVITSMVTAQHMTVMTALQTALDIEAPGVAKAKDKTDGQ